MISDTVRNKLNILVVEDEAMIAMFLEDMLIDLDCRVAGPVGAVAPALELIESGPVLNGALLDVNLRGEPAYPVADVLLRLGVPFVFVTGYAAHGINPRYGAIPAFAKPFPFRTLDRIVSTFAAQRSARRTNPTAVRNPDPRQAEACLALTSRQ
jgi:CheY-like chemotaxis protein